MRVIADTFLGVPMGAPRLVLSEAERRQLRAAAALMWRIADARGGYEDQDEDIVGLLRGAECAESIAADGIEVSA